MTGERDGVRGGGQKLVHRTGFVAFPGLFDSVLQAGLVVDDVDAGLWIPGEPLPDMEEVGGKYRLMLPVGIRKVMVAGPLPSGLASFSLLGVRP